MTPTRSLPRWLRLPTGRRPASANADFPLLWTSTTVSTLGDGTTSVALPLVAVVTLHVTTLQVGLLTAAGVAAWIVVGLPAGVWVDRMRKRPLLVACDVVRALALVSVPITAATGTLTFPQLLGVAAVVGIASVFATVGFQSYLPFVVPGERLLRANARIQAGEQVALMSGPAVGGGLVQWVGAPTTLLADVASYVVSALCLRGIGRTAAEPVRPASASGLIEEMLEGLRFVWHNRTLRALTLTAAGINLWSMGFIALFIVFLVRSVHVSPGVAGVLLTCDGVGGVLGAVAVGRLVDRIGNARTLALAVVAGPLLSLLIPLTTRGAGLLLFVVGVVGFSAFVACVSVVARVYRQRMSPPELIGRVTAVNKFISWGVMPIGAAVAGALGSAIGIRTTMWVIAVGLTVCVPLPLATSRIWWSRELALGDGSAG